ncbi:MAG TPA: hypothetical protein VN364_08115 [Bellilinea sp.]|nr:hypothetical protein [Bellilinea sp.]
MDPKTIEHKKLGVKATIKPLKQRDLESFGAVLAQLPSASTSQRRGANVRAAITAEWFSEIQPAMTVDQVADQEPVVIKLLGDWIDQVYGEVTIIPPE